MKSVKSIRDNRLRSEVSGKNRRVYFLAFSFFLIFLMILFRLVSLQIVGREKYRALAEDQHKAVSELEANRGEIFLTEGDDPYPLAINRQFQMLYAVPKDIENSWEIAAKLAPILEVEQSEIERKLSDHSDPFEILKKKLSDDQVAKIKELNLDGIYFSPEIYRYYPSGDLASQLVGFVGSNGHGFQGMYGLEASWENQLQGRAGHISQERDSGGRWISVSDRDFEPAENGIDLVLSVDHTIQYEAEKNLRESVEGHQADDGSIIVMQPKTGKILAMASYPNFDPNNYSETEDISLFNNPIVSTPYEPGSVFKPITMAMAINEGKVSPSTEYVDQGFVSEAGYNLKNSEGKVYGRQTMTQVLEESINTGVIFAEKLIGNEKFLDYVDKFGFGSKTGINLPAEVGGSVINLQKTNRTINFFTASFGQGISVTPVQLVSAFSAIANGGDLMRPQVVEKIIHSDGREEEVEPEKIRSVISKETSKSLGEMLRAVVMNGHGKRADVPGYLVGGKTGTAQVAKADARGYEDGVTIGSFIGYAPLDDPQFVILVKISNPKDVMWAESTAAPLFGKIMKFLLEYYKVQPTEDPKISPMYDEYYGQEATEDVSEKEQEDQADQNETKDESQSKKDKKKDD